MSAELPNKIINAEHAKSIADKIGEWLSALERIIPVAGESICRVRSVSSTCNSPGCVIGWTWQAMPKIFTTDGYHFSECEYEFIKWLGIEVRESEFIQDWFLANPSLVPIKPVESNIFANSDMYESGTTRYGYVPITTVIERWRNYQTYILTNYAFQS